MKGKVKNMIKCDNGEVSLNGTKAMLITEFHCLARGLVDAGIEKELLVQSARTADSDMDTVSDVLADAFAKMLLDKIKGDGYGK